MRCLLGIIVLLALAGLILAGKKLKSPTSEPAFSSLDDTPTPTTLQVEWGKAKKICSFTFDLVPEGGYPSGWKFSGDADDY